MDDRTRSVRDITPSARVAPSARLRVVWASAGQPEAGALFPLRAGSHEIGRQPGAGGVALSADRAASRVHVVLEVAAGKVTVEDRGSRNGTFVDGQRLAAGERRELRDGGVLRVGETLFVLRTGPEEEDGDVAELLGWAPATRRLRRQIERVARDPATVLLLGETGTGKEVAATAIHRLSGRSGARVAVNVSAITDALVESQFFGHLEGAFTGARAQQGFFRAAHGGTLFLDELGELPLAVQPKLLRAIEERAVIPVGDTRPISVDVRLVAATNREIDRGGGADFRDDLYARLSDIVLRLPPLRERREDVLLLLAHASGGRMPDVPAAVAEQLVCYSWPRNVREVLKVASHLRLLGADRELLDRLAAPVDAPGAPARRERSATPGRDELEALMTKHRGVILEVAEELGCSRRNVGRWLDQYGIDRQRFR